MTKLSICICSIHSRWGHLAKLLAQISSQPRSNEIETLVFTDGGQETTGNKRNQLVAQARGLYVVHVDDDDEVSPNYLARILQRIDEFGSDDPHQGADAIAIMGERVDIRGIEKPVKFGYSLMTHDNAMFSRDVLWRSPGHLCPIKRSIAQKVFFPEQEPEDIEWGRRVRPFISTLADASVSAGETEILYHYRWDSQKVNRWQTT